MGNAQIAVPDGLLQRIDIRCERLAVIIGGWTHQRIIRLGSLVDIIERAVFDEGQTQKARDLERCTVRRGQRKHHTASAAGRAAHQRGPVGTLQNRRHQIGA